MTTLTRSQPGTRANRATAARRRRLVASVVVAATTLLVPGCGGAGGEADVLRSYALPIRAEEDTDDTYDFIAEATFDIRVGDQVTFEFYNAGALPHDLQVLDERSTVLGTTPIVGPGESASVTVVFERAGKHRLHCNVGDHLTLHRMRATIEVAASDPSPA